MATSFSPCQIKNSKFLFHTIFFFSGTYALLFSQSPTPDDAMPEQREMKSLPLGPPYLLCTFMLDFCFFADKSQPPFPEAKEYASKSHLILHPLLGLYNLTNLHETALFMSAAPP